jgi:hypothetical protein
MAIVLAHGCVGETGVHILCIVGCSFLLDDSGSCGVGSSSHSGCTGSSYISNWCTSGAGSKTYGHPVMRSCSKVCHTLLCRQIGFAPDSWCVSSLQKT